MTEKFQVMAVVAKSAKPTDSIYNTLVLTNCESIVNTVKPGQFIMVWPEPDSYEHLLGRPFSICQVYDNEQIKIGFKIEGKGTRLLAKKDQGDRIQILGPLGNGFYAGANFKTAIIVAGGTGILSLTMLISEILQKKKRHTFSWALKQKICYSTLKHLTIYCISVYQQMMGALVKKVHPVACSATFCIIATPIPFLS